MNTVFCTPVPPLFLVILSDNKITWLHTAYVRFTGTATTDASTSASGTLSRWSACESGGRRIGFIFRTD